MQTPELIFFQSTDELARAVAGAWLDEIAAANRAGNRHHVALSGGRITQKLFSSVVEISKSRGVALTNAHFFWADERCVPPDHAESNFRMADELLFAPLKISGQQVHRIRGEEVPHVAAASASTDFLKITSVLDLVLLGIGEDGHVASLFPNATLETFNCKTPFLAVANSPKPPPDRVSLSYAAIAAAREVWVVASGAGKEAALRESLKPGGATPLARVIAGRARTRVFTDIRLP